MPKWLREPDENVAEEARRGVGRARTDCTSDLLRSVEGAGALTWLRESRCLPISQLHENLRMVTLKSWYTFECAGMMRKEDHH
jgi:hypothetical protein